MKIEVLNISKKYKDKKGDTEALKNVTLSFPKTGFVFISGTNGSGKSTLLNCIGLLDEINDGDITYDNKSLKEMSTLEINEIRKNKFSFIFQNNNLISSLSIKDNINIDKILFKSKEEYYLPEDLPVNRTPKKLSGGQQQMAVVNRAICDQSDVLFCDKPTSSLDYDNTLKVLEKIKEISKTKLVIYVAHNKELLSKYADRIIEIEKGVIISDTVINEEVIECSKSQGTESIKKINPLFYLRFTLSFLKSKVFLGFLTIILYSLFFLCGAALASVYSFDDTKLLSDQLEDNTIYSTSDNATATYDNIYDFAIDITTIESNISNYNKYLGENGYGQIVYTNYGIVSFYKNSNLSLGKAKIGTSTLLKYFNTSALNEPINLELTSSGFSFNLSAESTFEGEGIICDYNNINNLEYEYIYLNGYQAGFDGVVNSDSTGSLMYTFFKINYRYYPESYYNNNLSKFNIETNSMESVSLNDNEILISNYYFDYEVINLRDDMKYNYISIDKYSNKDIFNDKIFMESYFSDGVTIKKVIEQGNDEDRFVIVSDEVFERMSEDYLPTRGIDISTAITNKDDIANMVLDCSYHTFDRNTSLDQEFYSVYSFAYNIRTLRGSAILPVLLAIIAILLIITLIISMLILKDNNSIIGIVQYKGINKYKSYLLLSAIQFVYMIISIVISIIAVIAFQDKANYSISTLIYQLGYKVIRLDISSFVYYLLTVVFLQLSLFVYCVLVNKNKRIVDYFK